MNKNVQQDNKEELLPLVDEKGNVIGSSTRGICHDGIHRPLHPVVHLHIFNSNGDIYLQRRPLWKDIQPGRWDTAVGGHVDWNEDIATALKREAYEELGISTFEAEAFAPYVFECARERELVYPHRCIYNGTIQPSAETDGGKFWPITEVYAAIGKDVLTPNFEKEFLRLFPQKL